jgi:hypothetical protein
MTTAAIIANGAGPNAGGHRDIPLPADYGDDSRIGIAAYRLNTGEWFLLRSSDGGLTKLVWGRPG